MKNLVRVKYLLIKQMTSEATCTVQKAMATQPLVYFILIYHF